MSSSLHARRVPSNRIADPDTAATPLAKAHFNAWHHVPETQQPQQQRVSRGPRVEPPSSLIIAAVHRSRTPNGTSSTRDEKADAASSPSASRQSNSTEVSPNAAPASKSTRSSLALAADPLHPTSPSTSGVIHRGSTSLLLGPERRPQLPAVTSGRPPQPLSARALSVPAHLARTHSPGRDGSLIRPRYSTSDLVPRASLAPAAHTLVTPRSSTQDADAALSRPFFSSGASATAAATAQRTNGATTPRAELEGASTSRPPPTASQGAGSVDSPEPKKPSVPERRAETSTPAAPAALYPPAYRRVCGAAPQLFKKAPWTTRPRSSGVARGREQQAEGQRARAPRQSSSPPPQSESPPQPQPQPQPQRRRPPSCNTRGHPMRLLRASDSDADDADSLAASDEALSSLARDAPFLLRSAFLSGDVLAINEVRAMDDASDACGVNGGGGVVHRPWEQRGASTPRPSALRAERRSQSASPVMRALRGGAEMRSAATTPRLSTSTPRFTVATSQNSVPYTMRVSRAGSLSSSSVLPGVVAVASAGVSGSDAVTVSTETAAEPAEATAGPAADGLERSRSSRGTLSRTSGPLDAPTADAAAATPAVLGHPEAFMRGDSQDYVATVAEQVARHYYVILTSLELGRGAALQAEPPLALCLRSMVIDLNTVASLLSYNARFGIRDLLFDDCAFGVVDFTWVRRLTGLTALRFKGASTTTAIVNRMLACAPAVEALTLIQTSCIASLASLASDSCGVQTLQLIQTDFTTQTYSHVVNCLSLRQIMLLQVQLRVNVFDLFNTNHVVELHLVGCPNLFYHDLPAAEWLSSCSPRQEELTPPASAAAATPPTSDSNSTTWRASTSDAAASKRSPVQQERRRRRSVRLAFPLRALVLADCPGVELRRVPLADFGQLTDVSLLYQRGVRAADLAEVLSMGRLRTLRLQQVFVDAALVAQLRQCKRLQELNLSFCRGMRGLHALWPAVVTTLRVLNVSYSDVDDGALLGLERCDVLAEVYARGCAYLRDARAFGQLAPSVALIDLTDCAGLLNEGLGAPFACTGLRRLVLDGCSKVRDVTGIRALCGLEELSLARTAVEDDVVAGLATADSLPSVWRTLTTLDLSGCRCLNQLAAFTVPSPARTVFAQLTALHLSHSSINNAGVAHLARAVAETGPLRELDLSHCAAVSDVGPLGAVRGLRTLNVSFSGLVDDGLTAFVAASRTAVSRALRVLELQGCTGLCNVGCLARLPRLAVLRLSGCSLDGPLSFGELAACPALEELDLSECMQIDSIVALVPALAKLRALNLSLTDIGDDSVAVVCGARLAELEELQLSGCVRVTCVAALGTLPLLQRLNLSATGVTDVTPLAACPLLWDLSLASCAALTSLQPLASARALQRLDASRTAVTSDSFGVPWTCPSLEEVDLHGCTGVREVGAGALRRLTALRRVNLAHTNADDTAVAALAECPGLCELRLQGCLATTLAPLGALRSLQVLLASDTAVTDAGLAGLEAAASLTTLDLSGCAALHDVSALRTLRGLSTLRLRGSGVTDASFAATWQRSGVRLLDLSRCAGVQAPASLGTLRELECVTLAGSGLTDAGLQALARCLTLRRLDVSHCGAVTDLSPLTMLDGLTHLDASGSGVQVLAAADGDAVVGWTAASRLRHVSLRGCAALVDVSALRHLKSLAVLDLSGSAVGGDSFADSWAECESLEEVVLASCRALTHVRGLWAAPHLRRLNLSGTAVVDIAGAELAGAALEVLDLSGCTMLADASPLRHLARLQQLQAYSSGVADVSFAEPWTAPSLLEVDLSSSKMLRDVTALGSLPSLRHVDLSDTYVVDEGVRGLIEAPMLEELDLRDCTRLAHLVSLARMPHIRALYLSRTCVGNFTFSSVSRCKRLEVLEMEGCPYVSNVFVMFELGQLRSLKFPPLSRMVGSVLQTCLNLEVLSLQGCPASFEVRSFAMLPRLRVLDMRESAIETHVLAALDGCAALEEVNISYCARLVSLQEMGALPRLRCLLAAGLPIRDASCEALGAYPLLEKLVLAECMWLRDVSALRRLPQLHHLDVSESGITEASFRGIRDIRSLEELSVRGCTRVGSCHLLVESAQEAGVPRVRLPRLRLVDFSGTGIASSADMAALRRQCPLLTKVYMDDLGAAAPAVPTAAATDNVWKRLLRRVW